MRSRANSVPDVLLANLIQPSFDPR